MELLYLWLDDFRNIKEQGFDFSSEIKFLITRTEVVSGIKHIDLELSLNEDFVGLFPPGIINITGIIGENASGKSNLMDALKLLSGRLSDITSGLFFLVLNHKTKTIEPYFYRSGGVTGMSIIELNVSPSKALKNKYKVKAPVGYTIYRSPKSLNSIKEFEDKEMPVSNVCFISNTFNSRNEKLYRSILNESTNLKLELFINKYVDKYKKKDNVNPYATHLSEYHKEELRGLLTFVSFAKNQNVKDLPDLPKSLVILFNYDELAYILENFGRTSTLFKVEDLQRLQNLANSIIAKTKDPKDKLYYLIILCSLYYALRWDLFKPNRYEPRHIQEQIENFSNLNPEDPLFDKILRFLSPLSLDKKKEKSGNLRILIGAKMKRAIQKLSLIKENNIDNPLRFSIFIEDSLWEFLNLVFSFRYVEPSSFINYQWQELSSGQEAFLLQFSRLYNVRGDISTKMLWLLIDEGELYFHPQWQKDYINKLIQFTSFIFPDKPVQIFLTSHSPFIVSDLPRTNLIFLKKDKISENCNVTDIESHKLTFGSNIHMLYTDSFFMDSVIGSFAQTKINEFIDWAINSDTTKEHSGYYKKLLKQIGEPILLTKLQEMYAKKMGVEFELENLKELQNKIGKRIDDLNNNV